MNATGRFGRMWGYLLTSAFLVGLMGLAGAIEGPPQ